MSPSPDGRLVATASFDGTVKLWDVAEQRLLHTYRGHRAPVWSVAFSPNGKFFVTASTDRTLHVVSMETLRAVRTLSGHRGGVSDVAILPGGRHAISAGERSTAILWDLETGKIVRGWELDIPWIQSVAVTPDGRHAIFGGHNGALRKISLADGKVVRDYPQQPHAIAQIVVDPRGEFFISAAGWLNAQQDPAVIMWRLDTAREVRRFDGPKGTVYGVAISPDGKTVATAASDTVFTLLEIEHSGPTENAVWAWDIESGKRVYRWPTATRVDLGRGVTAVAFDPSGRHLLYSAQGNHALTMRLLSSADAPARETVGRESGKRLLSVSPDGTAVWMAASIRSHEVANRRRETGATTSATQFDGAYRVMRWDLRDGRRDVVRDVHNMWIRLLAPIQDGGILSLSVRNGTVPIDPAEVLPPSCRRTEDKACKRDGQHQHSFENRLREVVDDGNEAPRMLDFMWDAEPALQKVSASIDTMSDRVSVSRSGRLLAIGLTNADIGIYARSGDERRLQRHIRLDGAVLALGFGADETQLVAGVCDKPLDRYGQCSAVTRLAVFDTGSGQILRKSGTAVDMHGLAVSPDGLNVVSIGSGAIVLWSLKDLSVVRELTSKSGRFPRRVAWFADGRRIVVAKYGGTIEIWDSGQPAPIRSIEGFEGNVDDLTVSSDGRTLFAVSDDGALRVWDVESGVLRATMTEFDDGEWITVTPEGYFVASQEGDRQLNVRHGERVYGMDQFYDVFYRPDIVERKLRGERIDDLVSLTLDDALRLPPPRMSVSASPGAAGAMRIRVEAQDSGGGIGNVRVFHNGKLIASDDDAGAAQPVSLDTVAPAAQNSRGVRALLTAKARTQNRRAAGQAGRSNPRELEVRLAPGENKVWAVGLNADDSLQSRPAMVELPAGPASAARVFVLAIGVDRYRDEKKISKLGFAVKDAQAFSGEIRARMTKAFPQHPIQLKLLSDSEASLGAVERELEGLSREMRPGDIFIWFIASHGMLDGDAAYNVLLHDADLATPGRGVLPTGKILGWLKRLPALEQLVILDTCHAGGLDGAVRGLYDARLGVLARSMGLHILASASAAEEAIDGYKGNGLFTHAILQAMADPASDTNADRRLSVTELGRYSRDLTLRVAKQLRFKQSPMAFHFGRDMMIADVQ